MQLTLSALTFGVSCIQCLKIVDAIQGYLIALNTTAEVLFENGRAVWAAIWVLGGGIVG